jgi:hypothetical protein
MEKHTVTVEAVKLPIIHKAFSEITGPKPIMLSYKIGQILGPVQELTQAMQNRLGSYIDGKTGALRKNLKDEENEAVEAILKEEVSFEVPTISVGELAAVEGLVCTNDSVFPFLVDTGVLAAG